MATANSDCNFTPKEITPNKDPTGIAKTVYSHVSNLRNFLIDWVKLREKGTKLCKVITSMNLHEFADDYYPQQLNPIMENLVNISKGLNNIVEGVKILNDQLAALAQLQPSDQPVILTWTPTQISKTVNYIYNALVKEYKLKRVVTEHIAHCRDELLIEMYVSSWEFELYFNPASNSHLNAEFGLAGGV